MSCKNAKEKKKEGIAGSFQLASKCQMLDLTPLFSGQNTTLETALRESLQSNKPVVIDFWATWCGICTSMSKTTLKDAKVKKALGDFIFVKYQAERFNDPEIKNLLQYFKVSGLPTFVILKPGS